MAQGDGLLEGGIFKRGGANSPVWLNNIQIGRATTTEDHDSLQITGHGGVALSPENPGYISLPSSPTGGSVDVLRITADVTIDLTGAAWSYTDDVTLKPLYVYAINAEGTLAWGVGVKGVIKGISSTDTSATPGDINEDHELLTNTTVASNTHPCRCIGFVTFSLDYTGGAAEILWSGSDGDLATVLNPEVIPPYVTVFTTSATWVTHYGSLFVEAVGGGGGGGGADGGGGTGAGAGSGGGGGGYVAEFFDPISANRSVTIGTGGAGGDASGGGNGGTGTDTTFGSLLTAGGGAGGTGDAAPQSSDGLLSGGAGGTALTGTIKKRGENGFPAQIFGDAGYSLGGFGGSSGSGGGGGRASLSNTTGSAGLIGGGGSGGAVAGSVTDRAGGGGGAGICIVWEF